MRQIYIIIIFLIFCNLLSCRFDIDTYKCDEYGYQLKIPDWWEIGDFRCQKELSGTLNSGDSIKDNISIRAFDKKLFKDLKEFENWAIKKYTIGEPPDWSIFYRIIKTDEIYDFKNIGNAYKTQILKSGQMTLCCYIIAESLKSYLWIDYSSSDTTYDKNIGKLKYLMDNFKVIK